MRRLIPLLTILALLPACGEPGIGALPETLHSARGRFLYAGSSDRGLTLLPMSGPHQVLLANADDPLRPLPCYRARSLDPSIFTITLPDGAVVVDAAICRPFGLADSFFGKAGRAGDTAVEIVADGNAIDQIPLAVHPASNFAGVDQPLGSDRGGPHPLERDSTATERATVSAKTSP